MKKISYFLGLCAMVCCLAVGFASCSDDDGDFSSAELVGLWEPIHTEGYDIWKGEKEEWNEDVDAGTNDAEYERMEFLSDGTWQRYYYYNGWKLSSDRGTYRVEGNKIYAYTPYEDEELSATIVSLTSNRLVIEDKEDLGDEEYYEKITYKRVSD